MGQKRSCHRSAPKLTGSIAHFLILMILHMLLYFEYNMVWAYEPQRQVHMLHHIFIKKNAGLVTKLNPVYTMESYLTVQNHRMKTLWSQLAGALSTPQLLSSYGFRKTVKLNRLIPNL